ncbi:hypothetical protein Tco_1456708 [Tanacetum coccineum]
MANLKFADTHNMVAFLAKPAESEGFEQIVDFLNAHTIKYALTINPTIYTSCIEQFWATVKAKTVNGEVQLQALVDGKKIIITESIVRRDLQLEDAEGVDCLPNSTIFEQLTLMGGGNINQEKMGEGSAMPTDPHHTPTIIQPSTSQPKRLKNLGGQRERTLSVEAEQDNGNINKTQSKATPNEPSSLGTSSGGGPRRQETMGIQLLRLGLRMYLNFPVIHCSQECVVRRVTAVTIPVSAATTTTTITDVEMTLAQALAELKNAKPKANKVLAQDTEQKVIIHESRACTYTNCFFKNHHIGLKIVVDYQLAQRLQAQEQNELTDEEKARLFVQFLEQKRKHFAAKRSEEKRNIPPTRAQQRSIITELVEESSKKAEAKIAHDRDDVTIDATPLSIKSPTIVDYKIYKEGKKSYFQIIKADGKTHMYLTFKKMLKNFDREDLEVLWSIVKARFKKTEPVNYMDNLLLHNLKTMFEHHG